VQSFRKLSPQEAAALKPLRVKLATVRPGDTVDSLASRMQGVDRPSDLFRVLNDLKAGAALKPGDKLKIIGD
jgi:predicted Zn-dependent protease